LGNVSRISPEAPVPVVLENRSFYTPGGSANVTHNLSSLGASVTQIGRIGNDFEGKLLKRQLKKKGVNIEGIFTDTEVPTITKTRVIAQRQQIVRIDKERIIPQDSQRINDKILIFVDKNIDQFDAFIISDYGKGLINQALVTTICDLVKKKKKILTIDPKDEHFGYYKHVTAITPNKKETENAIRNIKISEKEGARLNLCSDRLATMEDIDKAGSQLLEYLELDSLLITLGEHGMRLFEKGEPPFSIKTRAREVYDVSGAGDTVISVFTLCLAAGASKKDAADISNFAAGVVVGKMGAVAISREELLSALA
jgi:D-beta-D-heptose 7-phosphate kinase/D-beta-D-heptose 1-phosphate adenosyltransferase